MGNDIERIPERQHESFTVLSNRNFEKSVAMPSLYVWGDWHHLFRFTKIPNVKTMTAQAAARRASVRIASVAMPKPLCAMILDRMATVAAASTEKIGISTRHMQTQ
jgi:hypothetical protein